MDANASEITKVKTLHATVHGNVVLIVCLVPRIPDSTCNP